MFKQIFFTALLLVSISLTLYLYDRLNRLETQYRLEKESSVSVAGDIARLAREIRIATYPTGCDALAKELLGEECDVGNYMEWAGPHLERETQRLLELLRDRKALE
jgi:hypothetical protein